MTAPALFHESLADALREVVQALGGTKAVGAMLRPERGADAAGRWVADCINAERAENFHPEHVLFLLRAGRAAGCHAAANYLMREAGYADPIPVEPEDELARAQREFTAAVATLGAMADRIARLGVKAVA